MISEMWSSGRKKKKKQEMEGGEVGGRGRAPVSLELGELEEWADG